MITISLISIAAATETAELRRQLAEWQTAFEDLPAADARNAYDAMTEAFALAAERYDLAEEQARELRREAEQLRDEIATLRALIDTRVPGERLDELIDTWRHRAAVLREEGERAEANGFTACADALELVVSVHATGKD